MNLRVIQSLTETLLSVGDGQALVVVTTCSLRLSFVLLCFFFWGGGGVHLSGAVGYASRQGPPDCRRPVRRRGHEGGETRGAVLVVAVFTVVVVWVVDLVGLWRLLCG